MKEKLERLLHAATVHDEDGLRELQRQLTRVLGPVKDTYALPLEVRGERRWSSIPPDVDIDMESGVPLVYLRAASSVRTHISRPYHCNDTVLSVCGVVRIWRRGQYVVMAPGPDADYPLCDRCRQWLHREPARVALHKVMETANSAGVVTP